MSFFVLFLSFWFSHWQLKKKGYTAFTNQIDSLINNWLVWGYSRRYLPKWNWTWNCMVSRVSLTAESILEFSWLKTLSQGWLKVKQEWAKLSSILNKLSLITYMKHFSIYSTGSLTHISCHEAKYPVSTHWPIKGWQTFWNFIQYIEHKCSMTFNTLSRKEINYKINPDLDYIADVNLTSNIVVTFISVYLQFILFVIS